MGVCIVKYTKYMADPVAQLVEQCPFKALAEGSNPSWVTSFSLYAFLLNNRFDSIDYKLNRYCKQYNSHHSLYDT